MTRNRYYTGPVTDHFDGECFTSPIPTPDKSFAEVLRWSWTAQRERWPDSVAITPAVPNPREQETRITVVGHATLLIQSGGVNMLTDPLFSERASPFSFAGPRRVSPPGVRFEDLPKIDIVLLSHNHYDHLDAATLKKLVARDDPRIITPLGNDTIVRKSCPRARTEAGDWWSEHWLGKDMAAAIVPAQHWSARGLRDRRHALWCGFMLQLRDGLLYFAGDTAYGDGGIFRDLRQRFGEPDLALLPIGAYRPRWFMGPQHTDPDEAVQIMQDLGARRALGIHWGVFPLSDEGRDTPREDLARALNARAIPPERFPAAEPGSAWDLLLTSDGSARLV